MQKHRKTKAYIRCNDHIVMIFCPIPREFRQYICFSLFVNFLIDLFLDCGRGALVAMVAIKQLDIQTGNDIVKYKQFVNKGKVIKKVHNR